MRLTLLFILVCFISTGCKPQQAQLTLVAEEALVDTCTIALANEHYQLDSLAFFIAELEVKIDDQWQSLEFIPSQKQTKSIALVDFATSCETTDTLQTQLPLNIDFDRFQLASAIRFTLGVPFKQNHRNPVGLPPPLNIPAMFWSWQRGHKFVRIDLSHANNGHEWHFHLGSVGCQSDSVLRSPKQACRQPNLYSFELEMENPEGRLQVNLQNWFNGIDTQQDSSCMFATDTEASCATLIDNIQRTGFNWMN